MTHFGRQLFSLEFDQYIIFCVLQNIRIILRSLPKLIACGIRLKLTVIHMTAVYSVARLYKSYINDILFACFIVDIKPTKL